MSLYDQEAFPFLYVCNLTQSGANAPDPGVLLFNNFPGIVTWARTAAGRYRATFNTGVLRANKTYPQITSAHIQTDAVGFFQAYVVNTTTLEVDSFNLAGALADDVIGINGVYLQVIVFR